MGDFKKSKIGLSLKDSFCSCELQFVVLLADSVAGSSPPTIVGVRCEFQVTLTFMAVFPGVGTLPKCCLEHVLDLSQPLAEVDLPALSLRSC